jgi:hypothetical protein
MGPLWLIAVVVALVIGWRCGQRWERAFNSAYVDFLFGLLHEKDESMAAYLDRGPISQERGNDSHTLH